MPILTVIVGSIRHLMDVNEALEAGAHIPTVTQLLPVVRPEGDAAATPTEYIFEPERPELLAALLPRYIETQVLRSMLESSAAEYAARMVAMDSATKNAGDVIEALTLHMNKVRQAAITKEIIEIVSGANYGA